MRAVPNSNNMKSHPLVRYDLLSRSGHLEATINLSQRCNGADDIPNDAVPVRSMRPLTLAEFIDKAVPSAVQTKLAVRTVRMFSAQIHHSLAFELHWVE
jgi:hypothetical protein